MRFVKPEHKPKENVSDCWLCVCVWRWWDVTKRITVGAKCGSDYTESDTHSRTKALWLTRRTSMINVYCRRAVSHRWRGYNVSIIWTGSAQTNKHWHTKQSLCVGAKLTFLSLVSLVDLWDSAVNKFSLWKCTFEAYESLEPADSWWNGMKYQWSTENKQKGGLGLWLW